MRNATAILILFSISSLCQAQITDLSGIDFVSQAAQIRADLTTDKYSEITSADRARVLVMLDRMESHLDGVSDISSLSDSAKIAVFNDQEHLNKLLTGAAADSREVCRREIVVGSNRRVSTCLTVAERRRRAERAQESLGDAQRMFPASSR